MRLWTAGLLALLSHLALTGAWDVNFKRSECYKYGLENLSERMPITMGNLVALIAKMENSHTYVNPDAIAEALTHRYRIDGITYANPVTNTYWDPNQAHEINKAQLTRGLVIMDQTVPEFTFEPREECSLHFMLSHSVDLYPHAGLDYVWVTPRIRRQAPSLEGRSGLPGNIQPATHPIENGVIWTPAGPVAAGTLLAGIAINDVSQGITISQIYPSQNLEFMPDLMTQKRVMPLHAVTLAGDIGQSALIGYVAQVSSNDYFLGPRGMFANSTVAPKLFTLEKNFLLNVPYMTRAEVFAGIDSLLIQKVLRESNNNQLSLSDALRMYYSDHGLPGYPDYRACNRMAAFKSLQNTETIQEQALHFMYAYSEKIPSVRTRMHEYKDDFNAIENAFKEALQIAWNSFSNFVDNYDYSDYERCPTLTSNQVMCENKVDLLVVYGYEGGETETQKERDYIGHLAQLVDVGVDRSRIGVLDGKSAKWIYPMTNFSNVADWASNFSESTSYSYGSGSDMLAVLAELNNYYDQFYKHMLSDASNASANAQVVLWNSPSSVPDQENFLELMEEFRHKYPDVYFLFVGKSKGNFNDLMIDQTEDFFTTTGQDMETFAKKLATRICKIPSVFTYPSCNPYHLNFTNTAESSHVYTGYISPNFTTYIRIPPMYFLFSEKVSLHVTEGDVSVCGSRTSINVEDNVEDRRCEEGNNMEWWYMCGRYVEDCSPIYLAVTGSSARTNTYCQDKECQYPNQLKFQIQHDGMTCGAWSAPPSLLILLVSTLVMFFNRQY